jgi:hypothetical protein
MSVDAAVGGDEQTGGGDSVMKIDWLQRLGKWRMVFAGWQLGTRPKGDPEGDAVRDDREVTMAMRAEINALTLLMIKKGVFTAEEFTEQLQEESRHLCEQYERRFPGFKATDDGMHMDLQIARDTTAGWRP